MVNILEIKEIKIASFTLITSSVQAILAFIYAVVLLIFASIAGSILASFVPGFGSFIAFGAAALIIIYPISAFFIGLMVQFFSALLYNILVPRVGGVKLGLEGDELVEIPAVSFALILSIIGAVWAFIVGLFLAAVIVPMFAFLGSASSTIPTMTNVTGVPMVTGAAAGVAGIFGALILIIGLPIAVFIIGFISNALAAIFYNFIATRIAKAKLEFEKVSNTLHELKSVPPIPAALSIAVVFTIFGIFAGILNLIRFSLQGDVLLGVGALVGEIIWYFILYFVSVALGAFFYNYLVPKIGGIKLKLE
ncbi:MAG: hypothetical protein HVN34_07415 [Methanobacteriaceae archaeon]|jgi:uncharacterized protein (DUF2164 family)|nr:hypothetical protein [Methanobacteriaceae archaeon]OPY23810.1 MAG: hypothetical protein A4E26_00651 [Methanobacterium sp. PtaU1.Bin097]